MFCRYCRDANKRNTFTTTGMCSGITTPMKKRNPFILSMHDIAYRLVLASGKAANNVPYLKKYQQDINMIYKYYHYSPKHFNTLQQVQFVLECTERKFHQAFHTRWLSFDGAVQAVLTNLEVLISALISDSNFDPTTKGILSFITTFLFLNSYQTYATYTLHSWQLRQDV